MIETVSDRMWGHYTDGFEDSGRDHGPRSQVVSETTKGKETFFFLEPPEISPDNTLTSAQRD